MLLPGVDEGRSRWEPQNKEPLEAPQSTRGLKPEGSVQPLVGDEWARGQSTDRLGPSFATHQDPRIQEQLELQSRREQGRACLSQSSIPRGTGRAPPERAARERPPPPGSPGHPASPGRGPAITLFPPGLPKAPGTCPQAQDAPSPQPLRQRLSNRASGREAVSGQPPLRGTL